MSINDTPEIRALFVEFFITEVKTSYSIQGGGCHEVGELLISNIDLDKLEPKQALLF